MHKKLHLVCTTSAPNIATRMLKSILLALPSYDITISILLIGIKSIDKIKFPFPIKIIRNFSEFIPIVKSRNICQKHLKSELEKEGGIGMILDDDLHWTANDLTFSKIVRSLIQKKCDMAFIALSGDPPIPKEYTRASPLLDILLAICLCNPHHEIKKYIKPITITNNTNQFRHHDIYAFNKLNFSPEYFDLKNVDWNEIIEKFTIGKSTTRQVFTIDRITSASGRERGGATIIFNHEVLRHKNIAFKFQKWTSRRSDMIMANIAFKNNFTLHNTPPLMRHIRNESFDSHNINKLIGDILGASLVECLFSNNKSTFEDELISRCKATISILKETTKMLLLLKKYFQVENIGENLTTKINNIIDENSQSINSLNNLKIETIQKDYSLFVSKFDSQF